MNGSAHKYSGFTGYRPGKLEISALRLSGREQLVTLRSSSLSVGLTPRSSGKRFKDLENKPSSSQLPMSLNVDDVVVIDKERMAEPNINPDLMKW